jgi:hypothetical protein
MCSKHVETSSWLITEIKKYKTNKQTKQKNTNIRTKKEQKTKQIAMRQ